MKYQGGQMMARCDICRGRDGRPRSGDVRLGQGDLGAPLLVKDSIRKMMMKC